MKDLGEHRLSFAKVISTQSLGVTASSIMTGCEHYGMTYGCNAECPVLTSGRCELQDSENKELYKQAMQALCCEIEEEE